MDTIEWCIKQNKGIQLVEPNENLRNGYLLKAEEALDTIRTSKSRDWQITAAYYTIYHSIYSLLMKIGIKCEIHSCTIKFSKTFLNKYLSNSDFQLIDKAFTVRIDSQYYINRKVPDDNYNYIIKNSPNFLVKCKNIVLNQTVINNIRTKIISFK
jgi:uncharacterized protein (UPF0332 family)